MRQPHLRSVHLAFSVLAALAAVAGACDGSSGSDPSGPPTATTRVAVDALIIMERDDPDRRAIYLVDPSTGTTSSQEWYVGRIGDTVAIAPDGQHIAYLPQSPGVALSSVVVASVVMQEGLPTLEIDRQFDNIVAAEVHWSPDGDRVYTNGAWLDPASGAVHPCVSGSEPQGSTVRDIAAFPGGHRYICASTLYDDGAWVGPADSAYDEVSFDGQFYGWTLHAPSGTTRPLAPGAQVDPTWSGLGAKLRLADGSFLSAPEGVHGKYVVEESGGFVTVFKILENTVLPGDGARYAYHDPFETPVASPPGETWHIAAALAPWLADGDGRDYRPVGLTADGNSVVYVIQSYIITYATDGTNAIYETPVESALVEIHRDGTSRGFRTSSIAARFASLTGGGFVAQGDSDWLVSGGIADSATGTHGAWFGYRGGKATAITDTGMRTPDGRWLYGGIDTAAGPAHCFRDLDGDLSAHCFPQANQGHAIGFMAQGLDAAYDDDGPIVLGTSRVGAWNGARVVVLGAHLGTSGTLTVGDTTVPASDIVSWGDYAITFTMSAALPETGRIRVATPHGKGGEDSVFQLHRTALVATPFDGVTHETVELGQGLNEVDLGSVSGVTPLVPGAGLPIRMAPASDGSGSYIIFSQGAATPTMLEVTLSVGAYQHALRFMLEDHLADTTRWQPVVSGGFDPIAQPTALVNVGGELVERANGGHLIVGPHIDFAQVYPKLPELLRPGTGGTWTSTSPGGSASYLAWAVRLLTGWSTEGAWGTPVFAATPSVQLPYYFRGVAADDQLVLFTGGDPLGESHGAYILSQDGGVTRGDPVIVGSDLQPLGGALEEPIYVAAQDPFFLVFEAGYGAPQVLGLHAIDRAGVFTPDVIDVPPDAILAGGTVQNAPLTVATQAGKVLLHFTSGTLVMADFDASEAAWTILPTAADRGHVRSFWEDPASHDVWAVKDDGAVLRATVAGGWSDFTVVDLGIALAAPIHVVPAAVAKLADGRMLVLAATTDATPGALANAPSLAGQAAWLVGPTP